LSKIAFQIDARTAEIPPCDGNRFQRGFAVKVSDRLDFRHEEESQTTSRSACHQGRDTVVAELEDIRDRRFRSAAGWRSVSVWMVLVK